MPDPSWSRPIKQAVVSPGSIPVAAASKCSSHVTITVAVDILDMGLAVGLTAVPLSGCR